MSEDAQLLFRDPFAQGETLTRNIRITNFITILILFEYTEIVLFITVRKS